MVMSSSIEAADLAADTRVQRLPAAPGWYTAELSRSWSFITPSGGVLMTIAMRAMRAELYDPELAPISATTVFCLPVPHGPLEIWSSERTLIGYGTQTMIVRIMTSSALAGFMDSAGK